MNFSLEDIKTQVSKVISYSQGIPEPKVDDIIDQWYTAKRPFILQFGGLIKETEFPVTLTLSRDAKRDRYNEFLNAVEEAYGFTKLLDFLCWLTLEEVFSNHTTRDYFLDGIDTKIPSGAKVSKALEHFELQGEELREIQDHLSMVIQEDKISGKLCFSVHPLDFLSSSENCHHWRSCHSLDGDYRMGNLSYMLDSSTIICYLCNGSQTYKLPNFPDSVPWNSKKWRMLLFYSETREAIFAGRQYPFFSPGALEAVRKHLVSELYWSEWFCDEIRRYPGRANFDYLNDFYVCINGGLWAKHDIIKDQTAQHFNDLLNSSCYTPYVMWNAYANCHTKPIFKIGKEIPCLCCGTGHVEASNGTMICEDCYDNLSGEERLYCACCDRSIPRYRDRVFVSYYDGLVCADCYDSITYCERCNNYYPNHLVEYDEASDEYICCNCKESKNESAATLKMADLDNILFNANGLVQIEEEPIMVDIPVAFDAAIEQARWMAENTYIPQEYIADELRKAVEQDLYASLANYTPPSSCVTYSASDLVEALKSLQVSFDASIPSLGEWITDNLDIKEAT